MNITSTTLRLVPVAILLMLLSVQCRENRPAKAPEYAAAAGTLSASGTAGEEVSITTADGVLLAGTFFPAGKSGTPAVVCLHQWMSDRTSYRALADKLVQSGVTVLAIDLRGFGGSTKYADGKKVNPSRQAAPDVAAAVAFLKGRPEVDGKRIGLIGASYGASNAVIYAADHPDVRSVILLSPGLNYFNVLPTEDAVRKYAGRPLFSAASGEDMRSVEAVNRYKTLAPANHEILLLENAGHGTNMLAATPDLTGAIVRFCTKNL